MNTDSNPLNKTRVVIADDDPLFVRLLDRMVTAWGFQSVVANNGFEASQILLSQPDTTLAIIDWEMPTMNGEAACRYVRQHRPESELYIMMISGHDDTDRLIASIDAGANEFVNKASHPQELKARLVNAQRQLQLRVESRQRSSHPGSIANPRELVNDNEVYVDADQLAGELAKLSTAWLAPHKLNESTLAPHFDVRRLRFGHRHSNEELDRGVQEGTLIPHLLDRALVCPRCESLPTFRLGCPCCGSGRVSQEELLHHYACAHVGPAISFETDGGLACPKCRMRHLTVGADLEYQQGMLQCMDCRWNPSDLQMIGHCLQCGFRFAAEQALQKDLVSYDARRVDILAKLAAPR